MLHDTSRHKAKTMQPATNISVLMHQTILVPYRSRARPRNIRLNNAPSIPTWTISPVVVSVPPRNLTRSAKRNVIALAVTISRFPA